MKKQPNSRMCFICGVKNVAGVHVRFYEPGDGTVLARFTGQTIHQGYPGRFHGGVIAGILDETMGRAIRLEHGDDVWGVTAELTVRYRQPVPIGVELRAVGRITKELSRMFEASAEILLPDGTVAAEGHGKFVKLASAAVAQFDPEVEEWRVWPD
ncbi:MAG: PaaI family thioesterase [Caldilineales bacterium]|nr:PaaI family thioesterase [Caldilineales bacterium]MDW8317628.1 PaaI family thioesterase [Anaerolineae bacterium]